MNRNTLAEFLGWHVSKSGDEQTSDALHVIRYWSPTAPDKIEARPNLVPDKATSIIIIEEFGIGMTEYGFIGNLGIITESGTKASTEAMAADGGFFMVEQFCVGFHSGGLVLESACGVNIHGDDERYIRESRAGGSCSEQKDTEAVHGTIARDTKVIPT
mmetsp:Transcript_72275/g.234705  ORF Transcript_72275/g.234705 Transcript_72275/m.234705 type:complete len:159 (+) Transcript_72275:273-749(+)